MKPISTSHRLLASLALLFLGLLTAVPAAWAQTGPLSVAVSATPDTVQPGQVIEYTFIASNTGTVALTNVGLSYLVPNNTKSGTDAYYAAGTKLTGNFGTIPPGQSRVVLVTVKVDQANATTGAQPPPDGTVITLNAIASNNTESATAAVDVTVAAVPTYNVQIRTEEQNFAGPGATVSYLVRFSKLRATGGGSALRVVLPTGTSFVSATDGGVPDSGAVQWDLGNLAAGQSGLRRVSVSLDPGLPVGSLFGAQAEVGDTANSANSARHAVYTGLHATTALGLTVTAVPDAVLPGSAILYEVIATNHTAAALNNVNLGYLVPLNTGSGTDAYYPAGTYLTAGIGNLPPGQSRTELITVLVKKANATTGATAPPDGSLAHLEVSATSNESFSADAAVDVAINAAPAFSVSIDNDDPSAAAPGATLNYTVSFGNTGANDAAALLRVPVPVGTTFVSASDGGAPGGDGVIQWNLGSVGTGQTGTRKFSVSAGPTLGAGSVVPTLAEVRDPATTALFGAATSADALHASTVLALSVTASPATTVQPGGTINYTVTATNRTDTALSNVSLAYLVPENTGSGSDGYYPAGTRLTGSFSSIPPGQSRQVVFAVLLKKANATTGAKAPPDGTVVHLDVNAEDSNGFGANASTNVFIKSNAHPAYFSGEASLGSGVYFLRFPNGNPFGYYSYLTDARYIFHFDLGYEYLFDAADGKSGVYLYDFKSNGFFYTSPSFPFPYLYDFTLNTVLYYYPNPADPTHYNTNGIRYFYRFDNGTIFSK